MVIDMSVIRNSVLGFAIGDAMGVPLKFKKRDELLDNPVTSMIEGDMEAGIWGGVTALTLATMDSISKTRRIDYKDMADRFCYLIDNGEYTATGSVFNIDNTTKDALEKYSMDQDDYTLCGGKSISDNNNGSLMRMLPIALYCYYNNLRDEEVYRVVRKASSITHANEVSILGCFIYVNYLMFLLNDKDKFASYNMIRCFDYSLYFDPDIVEYYNRLLKTNIAKLRVDDLKSEEYVVYTLETVFWVILNCSSYSESIVGAINLGGDTDNIGAITGSVAGILYDDISPKWLSSLKNVNYLEDIISSFEEVLL